MAAMIRMFCVACFVVVNVFHVHCTISLDFDNISFGKTICCTTPLSVSFGKSLLDCVGECLSWKRCASMSYQRKTLQCRLFDIDPTKYNVEDDPSYVMTVIDQWSQDLITPCQRQTCAHLEKCKVEKNGTTNCVPEDTTVSRSEWKKVYETDDTGDVVHGHLSNLIAAFKSASAIRIYVPTWDLVPSADTSHIATDNVCVQSLFNMDTNNWKTFADEVSWRFFYFCVSGHYQEANYHLGNDSRPDNPDKNGVVGIRWFIRRNVYGSHDDAPIYCNSRTGNTRCGSFSKFRSMIEKGGDVRLHAGSVVFHNIDSLSWTQTNVGAQCLRWLGRTKEGGDIFKFKNVLYWSYRLYSSNGTFDISDWFLGHHKNKLRQSRHAAYSKWFIDACWLLGYANDKDGIRLAGSIDDLRYSVLTGKRVRIVINGEIASEPDSIFIESEHVTAEVLGVLSAEHFTILSDAYWNWFLLSSNGYYTNARRYVESVNGLPSYNSTATVFWYVDKRPWRKRLSISSAGNVITGSKSKLIKSLEAGGKLRLVIYLPDNSTIAFSPNNIRFHHGEVGAQFMRNIGHIPVSGSTERIFPLEPYWQLTMVTTEGSLVTSNWLFGSNVQVGNSITNVKSDWFVN